MALETFLKISPWLTEKSLTLAAQGCYTFLVDKKANKPEVRKIISRKFKVKVEKVHIQNRPSEEVRRGRITGRRSGYKLALVYLEKGQKIEGFEMKDQAKDKKKDEKST